MALLQLPEPVREAGAFSLSFFFIRNEFFFFDKLIRNELINNFVYKKID